MSALPQDAVADLKRRIAELERQLETAVGERNAEVERQTASALVNFRLKSELGAALQRQNASAEILRAIANTHGDAEQALQQIAETTASFFNAAGVSIRIAEGDRWVQNVRIGSGAQLTGSQPAAQLLTRGANLPATVYHENRQIHIPDLDNIDPSMANWPASVARNAGIRTICGTPLRRGGKAIGAMIVYRDRLAGFSDDDLALQQSFADQAVIAIVNARLFNETQEALARQTATSDILRVISSSPTDVQPVFDEIVLTAARFLRCDRAFIQRHDDGFFWTVAVAGLEGPLTITVSKKTPVDPAANFPSRAIVAKETLYLPDWSAIELPEFERRIRDLHGNNSALYMPLLRGGECIGLLALIARQANQFGPSEIALAESFRDQALIAIENTRLFNETQEALERQTATADILKVIASSPSDLEPVLDALLSSACRLCEADIGTIRHGAADGDFRLAATFGCAPEWQEHFSKYSAKADSSSLFGRTIIEGHTIHLPDVLADPNFGRPEAQRLIGFRAALSVPLVREGQPFGVINLFRFKVGAFEGRQIDLLETFADQAVIAIENTRLFNETQEALERQTATADILKVIASSPSDVQPVFDAIAASANRLIDGFSTAVFRFINDAAHLAAFTPINPAADEALTASFPRPIAGFAAQELAHEGKAVQIADTEEAPRARDLARALGFRSMVFVPLVSDRNPIGYISVTRPETGSFADHHVQLLQTFADQAVIAIENTRLFNETKEALERQTATADILKVIASSPSDTKPVFEAIAGSAKRLLGGLSAAVFRIIDGTVHVAAFTSINPAADAALNADFPRPVEGFQGFQLARDGKPFVISDTDELTGGTLREVAQLHGFRSMLYVPLMNGDVPFGIITVTRAEPGGFLPHHIQLLQTFADQAVIAIENTRLFNEVQERTVELTEALEQQTATAEVLGVISSSAGDLAPVFDAMLGKAMQLCSANFGVLNTYDGKAFLTQATYGLPPAYDEYRRKQPLEYGRATAPARLLEGEPFVEFTDLPQSEAYRNGEPNRRALVDIGGARCLLAVPLLKDERVVGNVMIFRQENRPFSEKQIALLQQFAAQAVIAIENTRLLRELRESTEDLSESLQQQTATSDLLQVISRSAFDLQPIFDAIAERSVTLCGADRAFIFRFDDELLRMAAAYNAPPDFKDWVAQHPIRPGQHSASARAALERRTIHIHDVRADTEYTYGAKDAEDIRTVLGVPILKGDELLGVMMIYHLEGVRPFTGKQIALVETFADQAAIAIENVRLFDQLQHRTDDLAEALQQQTATSEVLQIISSSPGDLKPVFDKMLENATRVCGAGFGSMLLVEDKSVRQAALYNAPAALAEVRVNRVFRPHPQSALGAAIRTKQVCQVEDLRTQPNYLERNPATVEFVELGGVRTAAWVPMVRDNETIGVITIYRQEVQLFDDKQIELVRNFAKQAVIAIENARLLRELRQRTDDLTEALVYQTGSSNILKVIASSPTDVQPALKAIVESACEICDANDAAVFLKEGDNLVFSAHHGPVPIAWQKMPINRRWISGRVVIDKVALHVQDVPGSEADDFPEGLELMRQDGVRTILSVPLLRENEAIGTIVLRRIEAQPFNDKQIELLKSFADQAVIAISNVRLFEQVQARTRELSKSLDDLRTAQDRLIQTEKLASLGQLTAGIAHEIKNPLNFVNNFSALSVELTDELHDLLKQAALAEQLRKEVDELTGLLKDNLSKVVQHGKRADSIVKNMLLHSREGSGEHRPADVNALVDESLNLAYHGARAEKPQFNVTLQRDFDPQAGMVEVFPQEITRVLLNLISNGFYAVTKRKADNGSGDFEPRLTATTRGGDDHVEIRIRDNGTGIPPEVKEKMFNPFFTTKPAGEGTGLGLSMSHDIIVKQHGGSIEVETAPGAFTEFRLVLPRTSRANGNR